MEDTRMYLPLLRYAKRETLPCGGNANVIMATTIALVCDEGSSFAFFFSSLVFRPSGFATTSHPLRLWRR